MAHNLKHLTGCVCIILFAPFPSCSPAIFNEYISWPFHNGFKPGATVTVIGLTGSENNIDEALILDFRENVTCSDGVLKSDAMFHMSARFGYGVVVYNTYTSNSYGAEEYHYGLPIKADSKFKISVTCLPDRFAVSINNKHFHDYNHRLPYDQIAQVVVRGNILVTSISVVFGEIF